MMTESKEREQFLKDVIIGFAEDFGYNGWRQIKNGTYDFEAGVVTFIDIEDDDKEYEVTVETIEKGIEKILEPGFGINGSLRNLVAGANIDNDAGNLDAELADCIVQAAVFGELVYG